MLNAQTFSALASQFSLSCIFITLYYLMVLQSGDIGWFYPQVLMVYAPLAYGLERLLLRRERTMLSFFLWNAAAVLVMTAAYLFFEPWQSISLFIFAVAFLLLLTYRASMLAMQGIDLRHMLLCLDANIAVLVLFIAFSAVLSFDAIWSIPILCGFAVAVAGCAVCRSGRVLNGKSLFMALGVFAAVFLFLWLLFGYAAAPAGQGVVMLWTFAVTAVKYVGRLLLWLLHAFDSLFPGRGAGSVEWEEPMEFSLEEAAEEEANPLAQGIVLAIGGVLLIAALILLLCRLRKIKLGGMRTKTAGSGAVSERASLREGLRNLFVSWWVWLKKQLYLRRYRNTPKGLYFFLVHRCRHGVWHKRTGETPREFLCRLASYAGENEALCNALQQLALEVDMAFYSDRPGTISKETSDMICRGIGSSVRAQYRRAVLSAFPKLSLPRRASSQ